MRKTKIKTDDIIEDEIIIEKIDNEEPGDEKKGVNSLGSKGRPKLSDKEKAKNRIGLLFTDQEIKDIEHAMYIDGVKASLKGKWCKQQILKALRRI